MLISLSGTASLVLHLGAHLSEARPLFMAASAVAQVDLQQCVTLQGHGPSRPATVLPAAHRPDAMVHAALPRHSVLCCTAGMVQEVLPRHSEMADPSLGNVDRILLVFACALPTFDTLQVGAVWPALSLNPSGDRRSTVGDLSVCCTPLTCCTRAPPACSSQQFQALDSSRQGDRCAPQHACARANFSRAAALVVRPRGHSAPSCACRPPNFLSLLRPPASLSRSS